MTVPESVAIAGVGVGGGGVGVRVAAAGRAVAVAVGSTGDGPVGELFPPQAAASSPTIATTTRRPVIPERGFMDSFA